MKNLSTYQKRFYILLVSALVLIVLSYHLSIKKTLMARAEYEELLIKEAQIASLDSDLLKWTELNQLLDTKFGNNGAYLDFQENLLHQVGEFCHKNKLVLSEFSEPFSGVDGNYEVETIILKIQGRFHPLLKLLHNLEDEFSGGKISSVAFLREKNFKTNKEELFLKLFVQKINKKDDEKEVD